MARTRRGRGGKAGFELVDYFVGCFHGGAEEGEMANSAVGGWFGFFF